MSHTLDRVAGPRYRIELPSDEQPLVSIVVLLSGKRGLAQRSLESIAAAHEPGVPSEVVIVVNTPDAATRSIALERADPARSIVRDVNTGTAVGWNLGFQAARGEYVALLHEDSAPEAGWLPPLLDAARGLPEAGALQSVLLNTDGGVGHGGVLTWREGELTPLTAANAPDLVLGDAPYPVSIASSAAMFMARAAWEAVGGFDERFFPAIRVDGDVCMALWCRGRSVLCVPRSRVRHERQAMVREDGGPLASPIYREFLIQRNRARWMDKWAAVLATHPPLPGGKPFRVHPDHLGAAVDRLRAWTKAGGALRDPPPTDRRLTGDELEGLDERLSEAHERVRDEFLSWLVEELQRAREDAGDKLRRLQRLEREATGGTGA